MISPQDSLSFSRHRRNNSPLPRTTRTTKEERSLPLTTTSQAMATSVGLRNSFSASGFEARLQPSEQVDQIANGYSSMDLITFDESTQSSCSRESTRETIQTDGTSDINDTNGPFQGRPYNQTDNRPTLYQSTPLKPHEVKRPTSGDPENWHSRGTTNQTKQPEYMLYPDFARAMERVSPRISLPQFDRNDPQIWVRRIIAIYKMSNITDQRMMYRDLLTSLPDDVAGLLDHISTFEPRDPFNQAVNTIISYYGKSTSERLRDLTDTKIDEALPPSRLYNKMMAASRDLLSPQALKYTWLNKLIPQVQIAAAPVTEITEMLRVADEIHAIVKRSNNTTFKIDDRPSRPVIKTNEEDTSNDRGRPATRSLTPKRDRPRSTGSFRDTRTRSPTPHYKANAICNNHMRFRHKARYCIKPCVWDKLFPKAENY